MEAGQRRASGIAEQRAAKAWEEAEAAARTEALTAEVGRVESEAPVPRRGRARARTRTRIIIIVKLGDRNCLLAIKAMRTGRTRWHPRRGALRVPPPQGNRPAARPTRRHPLPLLIQRIMQGALKGPWRSLPVFALRAELAQRLARLVPHRASFDREVELVRRTCTRTRRTELLGARTRRSEVMATLSSCDLPACGVRCPCLASRLERCSSSLKVLHSNPNWCVGR